MTGREPAPPPSTAALARFLGVSRAAVRKARRTGRIDPGVDAHTAARQWAARTDPAFQRKPVGPKGPHRRYLAARARYEAARAREMELRVKMLEGSLVDRDRAAALFFEAGKRARESWEQWPARVAAIIAAELGVEPHPVEQVLTKHVKEHLRKIRQDLRAQFR